MASSRRFDGDEAEAAVKRRKITQTAFFDTDTLNYGSVEDAESVSAPSQVHQSQASTRHAQSEDTQTQTVGLPRSSASPVTNKPASSHANPDKESKTSSDSAESSKNIKAHFQQLPVGGKQISHKALSSSLGSPDDLGSAEHSIPLASAVATESQRPNSARPIDATSQDEEVSTGDLAKQGKKLDLGSSVLTFVKAAHLTIGSSSHTSSHKESHDALEGGLDYGGKHVQGSQSAGVSKKSVPGSGAAGIPTDKRTGEDHQEIGVTDPNGLFVSQDHDLQSEGQGNDTSIPTTSMPTTTSKHPLAALQELQKNTLPHRRDRLLKTADGSEIWTGNHLDALDWFTVQKKLGETEEEMQSVDRMIAERPSEDNSHLHSQLQQYKIKCELYYDWTWQLRNKGDKGAKGAKRDPITREIIPLNHTKHFRKPNFDVSSKDKVEHAIFKVNAAIGKFSQDPHHCQPHHENPDMRFSPLLLGIQSYKQELRDIKNEMITSEQEAQERRKAEQDAVKQDAVKQDAARKNLAESLEREKWEKAKSAQNAALRKRLDETECYTCHLKGHKQHFCPNRHDSKGNAARRAAKNRGRGNAPRPPAASQNKPRGANDGSHKSGAKRHLNPDDRAFERAYGPGILHGTSSNVNNSRQDVPPRGVSDLYYRRDRGGNQQHNSSNNRNAPATGTKAPPTGPRSTRPGGPRY